MAGAAVNPDTISYSAAISACEKGAEWQMALVWPAVMSSATIEPNTISINAAITACEKVSIWQAAQTLLAAMGRADVEPNTISYSAAISACEKGRAMDHGLTLFQEMLARVVPQTLSPVLWCLAKLSVTEQYAIKTATMEAVSKLESASHPPQELSNLAWALAMLMKQC